MHEDAHNHSGSGMLTGAVLGSAIGMEMDGFDDWMIAQESSGSKAVLGQDVEARSIQFVSSKRRRFDELAIMIEGLEIFLFRLSAGIDQR